jgi:hypothetical protein
VVLAGLAGTWLYTTISIVHEQKEINLRVGRWYTIEEVRRRMEDTRWFTVEPFNPKLERATHSYEILNPVHNARYIGVGFLPLLVLVPFYHWRRKERWLVTVAVGVFCISLASPWFLQMWKLTPGMDHIFHFFYLYPHHLMLMLILLGSAALEKLLRDSPLPPRPLLNYVLLATLGVSLIVLLVLGIISDQYPTHSPEFEGLTRFGGLFFISSLLLSQMVRRPQWRGLMAALFLLVTFSDLTRYFLEVNQADHLFSVEWRMTIPFPLPDETQAAMRRSWPAGDPNQGFSGGVERLLPIETELWPNNRYLTPFHAQEAWALPDGPDAFEAQIPDVRFTPDGPMEEVREEVTGKNLFDRLLIHDRKTGTIQTIFAEKFTEIPFQFARWGYNDFTINVDCPSDGWVFLRLLHDPRWRVHVDGQPVNPSRANWMCQAFPVSAGAHRVELEYRPRARRILWPLCWLTEAALVGLLVLAWKNRNRLRLSG